jgi:hypothetical protein
VKAVYSLSWPPREPKITDASVGIAF